MAGAAYSGPMTIPGPEQAPRALRVLHVEDAELDHQLILAQLLRAGLKVQVERRDADAGAAFEDEEPSLAERHQGHEAGKQGARAQPEALVRGIDGVDPLAAVPRRIGEASTARRRRQRDPTIGTVGDDDC